ncbi:recombinase family protein [Gryllotalpicola reticulitermitis]|uniref:Recombinase family protein n=1 Tax=Gryllotalpicola reticulitermitis TaxID=1184153 RepID=A0ABV8Q4N3_9MICO
MSPTATAQRGGIREGAAPRRAAIYARISDDREGREHGVTRQQEDCRALARRLGYEVVESHVHVDNDISASTKSRKKRPAYTSMLQAARSGEFDVILAYSNSRLTRRPREFEDLIDLHDAHGTEFHTVVSGNDDLSTADGRMVARIKASVDAAEAERTAERVKRAKAQMAAQGVYRGGPRPYGFETGGLEIRESEAAVIRWAAQSVLAGRSLGSLTRELNERVARGEPGTATAVMPRTRKVTDPATGITTTESYTPKPTWRYGALRDMLLRPRNAGLLAHGMPGKSHARALPYEIVGAAVWPAIIEREAWDALVAVLAAPDRMGKHGSDPRHLLSGIARCGKPVLDEDGAPVVDEHGEPVLCGGVLRCTTLGGTAKRNYPKRWLYRCETGTHLTIGAKQTEAFVTEAVIARLDDPRTIAALAPDTEALTQADRDRRDVLRARLEGFDADYAAGDITASLHRKATERVQMELDEVQARLDRAVQDHAASSILSAENPGKAFLDAPLDMKKAVIASLMTITIVPAKTRGSQWDPIRIQLAPVTRGTAAAPRPSTTVEAADASATVAATGSD